MCFVCPSRVRYVALWLWLSDWNTCFMLAKCIDIQAIFTIPTLCFHICKMIIQELFEQTVMPQSQKNIQTSYINNSPNKPHDPDENITWCHQAVKLLHTREQNKNIFKGWMPRAVKPNWVGGPLRHNYCVILQRDAKLSLLSQKLHLQ